MEKQYRSCLNSYVAIWNESDQDKIERALASCVTQNVSYCDPFTEETEGIESLAKIMVNVSRSFPGAVHELVGEPAIHHNFAYYHWLARLESGREIPGTDYVEFGPEGTIRRVVSFTNKMDWH